MISNASALVRIAALVVIAATVAACSDNEPEQRKAFIAFLQTRVIDRQGVRIPRLTDEETKSVGPYASHYKVITDFTGDPALTAMSKAMSEGLASINNLQAVIDKRDALRKAGPEMDGLMQTMNDSYARTKAARDALKQPDDLKPVYDKAFDKTVTAPVNAFREAAPVTRGIIDATVKVADYAASHTDTVKIVGGRLQATNAKTQSELVALVNALTSQTAQFNEAQRKLRVILTGN